MMSYSSIKFFYHHYCQHFLFNAMSYQEVGDYGPPRVPFLYEHKFLGNEVEWFCIAYTTVFNLKIYFSETSFYPGQENLVSLIITISTVHYCHE